MIPINILAAGDIGGSIDFTGCGTGEDLLCVVESTTFTSSGCSRIPSGCSVGGVDMTTSPIEASMLSVAGRIGSVETVTVALNCDDGTGTAV